MEGRQEDLSPELLLKYTETIRHFRGYVDKERFAEDVNFLREFLKEVEPDLEKFLKAV